MQLLCFSIYIRDDSRSYRCCTCTLKLLDCYSDSVKLYKSPCTLCQLKTHFFHESLCLFYTTIILPKQSRGLLISHFSQTPVPAFHFSLKHCSLELWVWLYGTCGIIPNKPGNVRCRDNNKLISRSNYFHRIMKKMSQEMQQFPILQG